MAIYDCFQYYNEETVLDLRLNILNEHVNYFVVVESTTDHQGNNKRLNFNIDNYKKFKNKIIYVVVEDTKQNIKKTTKNHAKIGTQSSHGAHFLLGIDDSHHAKLQSHYSFHLL